MSILHQTPRSVHSRTWSTQSYETPPRSGEKFVKGILLTSKRNDKNKLDATTDRTTTPVSLSNSNSSQKLTLNHHLSSRALFRKDSPFPKKYKELRNMSLPAINFDYHSYTGVSGFQTAAQPYVRLFDNSTTQKKSSQILSQKYSPFTEVSTSKDNGNGTAPGNFKLTVSQCLKFDSSSPNKRQARVYTETSSKESPINMQKFTQTKTSQIYVAQTPKKLNSNRKQGSTLRSLKNKIMTNNLEEPFLKINIEPRRQNAIKDGFEFSHNIEPLQSKKQKEEYIGSIEINQETLNQRLRIFEKMKKNQQKIDFFALSPKISQQFEGSIYELTDSSKKGLNLFSPNWKLAESQSFDLSFIKPVKRKLALGQNDKQFTNLKESLILTQLLSSLKKNIFKQKMTFNLELARKCSQNLCLVRNKQSGIIFGLIKTKVNEKIIPSETQSEGKKLCVQTFLDFKDFIFTEPFEYTLQEIFQMKLIEEKDIPGLIRKFHPILNEIMQKGRGKINIHMLKQRIIYVHGSFKLIPLVESF